MGRMKLDKMVNIFNAYSGITPDKRALETAIGVTVRQLRPLENTTRMDRTENTLG